MKEKREFFRVDVEIPIFIRHVEEGDSGCCECTLIEQGFGERIKTALVQRLNISGAGICFRSDKPYQVGDVLEMRLMLEDACPGVIGLCTRVIRVEKRSRHHSIAVEYIGMTGAIRELIVKFVFLRQRAFIKEKKVGWL